MTMPPPGQYPPPPQGPPQGPPQWIPQPGQPPQRGGNKAKWILGGLALLVVVVVTVVATLLVTRGSSGSTTPTASGPTSTSVDVSDIASANDRGPAGIITEDPTCDSWTPIFNTVSDQQKKGWDQRDASTPASDWSPELRTQYQEVGRAILAATSQMPALARKTPHRSMRELYEQAAAYWRAYTDALPTYEPSDDHLVLAGNSFATAVTWICAAISYGSSAARAPLVARGAAPIVFSPVGDVDDPQKFISDPLGVCGEWDAMVSTFTTSTDPWAQNVDPNIPASQWTAEQQSYFTGVIPLMQQNADQVDQLGIRSNNAVFRDFASLAAQYRRGYIQAIPSYMPADNYLESTSSRLMSAVSEACKAAGS